jgi:hypothetical protein
MSLLDALRDIVKHTNSLGFIEMVKILGTATDAKIEAMDGDRSVVIYGTMYHPLPGIDTTVGLSRIGVLKGYMDWSVFDNDTSKIEVEKDPGGTSSGPTEIRFTSGNGHTAVYRFMGESMVSDQIKVPPFKGATWHVEIKPELSSIKNLAQMQGILGGVEKRFVVSVNKDVLNFSVGDGPTDKMVIPFATGITGEMKHQWSYPLSQILSILKLGDTGEMTMKISDMGALMIEIDSGVGKYKYILPAGKA